VTHRDLVPHHDHDKRAKVGKDLSVVLAAPSLPRRVILFDDRVANFTPQVLSLLGLVIQKYKY